MEVIRRNKGGTNKDLGKFADQIRALIQKWDR
jgi:metallo-beta-lactamase family protein